MCSDLNTSGKLFKTLNKKRKDGLTVFAELNTGGELCKKINCLASAMRRQFPIFTLFSVTLIS